MGKVAITFLGAVATVTGSRFLVTSEKSKVLVDAGLFQGRREDRKKNWDPFPLDPASIDAIVLTHAHLDHCGYLPLLVRQGFRNKIYATDYTIKLASVILRDSAKLQMEDAKFAAEKGFSKHPVPLPLYDMLPLRISPQVTYWDRHMCYWKSAEKNCSSLVILEEIITPSFPHPIKRHLFNLMPSLLNPHTAIEFTRLR
jgi:Cft2 family RNA processing exonuclease